MSGVRRTSRIRTASRLKVTGTPVLASKNTDTDIEDATGATYELTDDDVGKTIKVRVFFNDDPGNQETLISAPSATVVPVATASANNPAQGTAAIVGAVQVGETLTVDTSGISDQDGMENANYSFTWGANDIEGDGSLLRGGGSATTYMVQPGDAGKTLTAHWYFVDDQGNQESGTVETATVLATVPDPPENLRVTPSGTGELDIQWDAPWWDLDRLGENGSVGDGGSPITSYTVRWKKASGSWDTPQDVSEATATDTSHNIATGLELEVEYTVRAFATNAVGNGAASDEVAATAVAQFSQHQARTQNNPAGLPTITGTPLAGETLTADTSSITDPDGLTTSVYRYQWLMTDADGDTVVKGATASTYTLPDDYAGGIIKVKVSFTDDADNEEVLTSNGVAGVIVTTANYPATGAPTISGNPQVDQTLTADTSPIDDEDGLTNATFEYQWTAGGSDIDGATGSSYLLTSSEQGQTIQVRVTFTDDAENQETLTSIATEAVAARSGNTVWQADMLVIKYNASSIGAASADLFANVEGSGSLEIRSLWSYIPDRDLRLAFAAGVPDADNMTLQVGDLVLEFPAGSSGNGSFKWTEIDVDWEDGQTIAVRIVPTSTLAEPTPNTPATGLPTIPNTAQVGKMLTADTSSIVDADGLTSVSYGYQWIANDGTADTDLQEATASSYTPRVNDVGKTIKVSVSFTDDANNDESLTSVATAAVAATVPTEPLSLTVTRGSQIQELDASWQAPASNGGSAVTGYKVQWKEAADSWDTAADVSQATETGTTHTVTGLTGGVEYTVRVMATNDVGDGPASTEAAGTPAGATSQQNTEESTSLTVSSIAITSDPDEDDSDLSAYAVGRSGGSIVQSSTWASSVYRIGDDVKVTLTFSENVTVTGSPQLELAIGSNDRTADYESTDGSAAVFSYTVAEGDTDSDGIAIAANKLTLNGGSIKDVAENDANLTHNALAAQDGHKVDGVRPTLTGLYFGSSSGGSDGAYTAGEILLIRAEFTEGPIHGSVSGAPQVKLDFDSEEKTASWDNSLRFNDDRTWVTYFGYVVQEGDLDSDGPVISANSFDLNGGFIRDTAGNDAVLTHSVVAAGSSFIVDAVGPTVSSIAITSAPGDDDTYGTGDKIEVTVTFSENMSFPGSITCSPDVVHCKAELELDIGGTARTAAYQSHNGAEAVYAYTVQAGDTDDNGIAIGANKLTGLLIKDAAGTNGTGINDADLSHDAVTDDAGHKVSGASSSVTLSGDTTINFEENGEGSVATYTLAGSDDAITWSLSGDDSDDFSLASESATRRELKFTSSPNYEDPTDADTDNQYDVTIQASDGANTSTLQVTVLVTNVLHDADELPVITGTVQVGETLTVDTSPIPDTSQDTTFGYAWIRTDGATDTYIDGATSSSYTLTADDEGKTIKVLVGFRTTEGRDRLTSDATETVGPAVQQQIANSPATGAPAVTGTVQVGEKLTADVSGIADADGLTSVSYNYQWIAGGSDIDGATGSSYLLTPGEQGQTIQVRVTFTDDRNNAETLTSVTTVEVTAVPVPLTASFLAAPSSHDGDNSFTFELRFSEEVDLSYVTLRDDDALSVTDGEVTGASRLDQPGNLRWQIVVEPDSDADVTIVLRPTTDCGAQGAICTGGGKKLSGRVELTVNGPEQQNNSPTGLPTISGTPQVEETLTADTSPVDDEDGLTNVSYRYQWIADGTDIEGATGSSYELTGSEQGQTIQVRVSFTDDADNAETLTSAGTVAVAAAPNREATGQPTISGTPQVEETLTADTSAISDEDGLANVSYQYQWLRADADITGQTNSTYRLVSADEGKTIKVRVTFRDDADNQETLTSAATAVVAARPAPAVLLTASFANVPADHNGSNFTFQLSFSENVEAGYARIRDHVFTVTGATIDSASRITQGSNQGWTVEVNPTGNSSVTITLPETTDCNASGAICTDDSRKLSHSTSAIVAGLPAISVSDAAVQEAEGAVLVFSVTLSHASSRTVAVAYATSDGSAQAGSDYTATSATLTFNAGDTAKAVQVPVLTDSDDEGQETLTLTLSNPSQATLDDATGIGTIENGESSSGTEDDPPVVSLTATFSNMPATHQGAAFTFDLSFSENVDAGYARIRDDAFTISGGEIANAQRKTQGSNQNWTITVKPDGNGAITITLPPTTDCDATGAICTEDGRMLSNRLVFTVSGPGQ